MTREGAAPRAAGAVQWRGAGAAGCEWACGAGRGALPRGSRQSGANVALLGGQRRDATSYEDPRQPGWPLARAEWKALGVICQLSGYDKDRGSSLRSQDFRGPGELTEQPPPQTSRLLPPPCSCLLTVLQVQSLSV